MPIPKIIHFIWAGGEKLLPDENVSHIKAWAAKHPDFEVCLWIDKKTTPKELLEQYYTRFHFDKHPKVILKDITEEGVVDEYSRYHIDRLVPNYGASSDILRYSILSKIGGAYFDSDVLTTDNTKALNYDGLFDSNEKEILRIIQFTQNATVIGNDGFICTPGHPFMLDLCEAAKKNHQFNNKTRWTPYDFEDINILKYWTIATTGPEAVANLCLSKGMLEKADQDTKINTTTLAINGEVYHRRTKDISFKLDKQCYEPAKVNDSNWLKALLRKFNDMEQTILVTLESIKFEIKNMGVLRIDDHVTNIVRALGLKSTINELNWSSGEPTEDEINIANLLIKHIRVQNLDLSNCKLIQVATRYPCVAEYYQEYTPGLHDGNTNISIGAIEGACKNIHDNTRFFILQNYISHLYNQAKKILNTHHEYATATCVEQLAKSYHAACILKGSKSNPIKDEINHAVSLAIGVLVAIDVMKNGDLSLNMGNHQELQQVGLLERLRDQNIGIQTTGLYDFLRTIILTVAETKHSNLSASLSKQISKYLKMHPDHAIAITTMLEKLIQNEIIFNNEKVMPDEDKKRTIANVSENIISTILILQDLPLVNIEQTKTKKSEQTSVKTTSKSEKSSFSSSSLPSIFPKAKKKSSDDDKKSKKKQNTYNYKGT